MLLLAINNLAILQKPSFVQRLREAILYHYGATVGHFKLFFRFLKKKSYLDSETRISVRLQYGRTSQNALFTVNQKKKKKLIKNIAENCIYCFKY